MPPLCLDALPLELCLSQLCPLLGVRDRWHGLARASRRWRRLALLSVHTERHLDLTWCTREHELEVAVKRLTRLEPSQLASQLESVGLYGPRVSEALLSTLVERLGAGRLRSVDIESKQVDNAALRLLASCRGLRRLALHCIKLTDETLAQIARGSRRSLEAIDLSGCARISDEGVMAVANGADELRELRLDMCHRVTDRSVLALANRQSNSLERLSVDRCLKVSGLALCILMIKQRGLQALSFACCPKVQANDMHHLEQVTAAWESSQQLQHVQPAACQLRSLDLSGCAGIGESGTVALVKASRRTIQELNLSACLPDSRAAVAAVAQCAELRSLNVSLCRGIRNEDLRLIATGCQKLETLLLHGCVLIDDAGLSALSPLASQLTRLSIEFCYNVTDVGVQALVAHCLRLVDLNVKACNQLTTAAFEALANSPRREEHSWKRLYIGACADMETTAGYCAIVKDKFPRCRVHWV